MKRIFIAVSVALLFFSGTLLGEIPKKIGFQGRLTASSGKLLSGSYDLQLGLYDALTNGNQLWQETHIGVSIKNGLYSVTLGENNALTGLAFDKPYYLEVAVKKQSDSTYETLSPRITLTVSGYAINAEKLSGYEVSTSTAPSKILVMDSNGKLPADITGDAATVSGYSVGNSAGKIPYVEGSGQLPVGIIPAGATVTNTDMVDEIHASTYPVAGKLLALNSNSKLPASITGNAATVGGYEVSTTTGPEKLLILDTNGKLPADITGDAATVSGYSVGNSAGKIPYVEDSGQLPVSIIPSGATVTNTDMVDEIHASLTPKATYLLALDLNAKFPDNVLYGTTLDVDKVDGKHAADFVATSGATMSGNLDMGNNSITGVYRVDVSSVGSMGSTNFYGTYYGSGANLSGVTATSADKLDGMDWTAFVSTSGVAAMSDNVDMKGSLIKSATYYGYGGNLSGVTADTVNGISASTVATANKLLALDSGSKLPASITGDADTVDGIHASGTATNGYLYPLGAGNKFPNSVLNTGSGGGLDADTVDGKHYDTFVATSGATMSGNLDMGNKFIQNATYYGYANLSGAELSDNLNMKGNFIQNATYYGYGGNLSGVTADTVNGISASTVATANKLLALDSGSKLPASITGDADTVDGIHASGTATNGYLYPLGAGNKFPNSVLNTGSGNGLDADTVDGKHYDTFVATSGATMSGNLDMGNKFIQNATYYGYANLSGAELSDNLNMKGNFIQNATYYGYGGNLSGKTEVIGKQDRDQLTLSSSGNYTTYTLTGDYVNSKMLILYIDPAGSDTNLNLRPSGSGDTTYITIATTDQPKVILLPIFDSKFEHKGNGTLPNVYVIGYFK